MKQKLIGIICSSLLISPAMAYIQDDFVEQTLSKDLKIKSYQKPIIVDDFAEKNLEKNQRIIKVEQKINDSFAEKNTNKSVPIQKVVITEQLPTITGRTDLTPVRTKAFFGDSTSQGLEIPIRICSLLSTKQFPEEGDYVEFETLKEIKIKNKTYPQGTRVKARIETVSMNFSLGVPADIILGNFSIDNIPLYGNVQKIGANRALWVKPCSYIGTFFMGAGILLLPIRGGHAKVRPSEVYTVYYR